MTDPEPRPRGAPGERIERLLDVLPGVGVRAGTGRRRTLFAIALAGFVLAFALAYREIGPIRAHAGWLALAAVTASLTLVLNGLEVSLAGRVLGHRITLNRAVRIGVLGTAANLLPVPGSVLVRTRALREFGSGYRDAFRSNVAIGIGWVGVSFLLASLFQLPADRSWLGPGFMILGLAGLTAMGLLMRDSPRWRALAAAVVGVEMLLVLTSAIRLYAVLRGVGIEASFAQSTVLAVSVALAAAIGLFPGGLGIREVLAGALGATVGLPVAVGVVATSIDRLIGIAVLAAASAIAVTVPVETAGQDSNPPDRSEGDP